MYTPSMLIPRASNLRGAQIQNLAKRLRFLVHHGHLVAALSPRWYRVGVSVARMVALCVRWTASRMAALCVSSGTSVSKLKATVRLPWSEAPGSGAIHVLLQKLLPKF